MDILLIGIGLVVFALFHHVLPRAYEGELRVVERPSARPDIIAVLDEGAGTLQGGDGGGDLPQVTPGPGNSAPAAGEAQPAETDLPMPTPNPADWRAKFADRFTSQVIRDDMSYSSADIAIDVTEYDERGVVYYVADIYVASIDNLRTGLAGNKLGKGIRDTTYNIAKGNDAILAISGDYYGTRAKGVVIRNGQVYRTSKYRDVCVLYYDGTMATYTADEFDPEQAIANGAYQAWSFGPMLLRDGKAMANFSANDVNPSNPRSAIGYYEPGHYCFVVVDGRSKESNGFTLIQLSKLFERLGCAAAYNLDGGETAAMVFDRRVYNEPAGGGRQVSDIVYIGELK
ncbi:MAG: phosphodiester glycosidase family protein [Clostridiales bacterium]|nr:phosphodiester glycosidase family protein [Clostridiales bacterium]